MQRKLNSFMFLLVIIAVIMTSAVRVTTVYADDGGTEPVTEENAAPPGGEEASTEEESAPASEAAEPPADEPAPSSENPEQAPESSEPPATDAVEVAATEAPIEEGTALAGDEVEPASSLEAPEGSEPAATNATEESVTVAEVLEQLPEETALVVVNEAGEVESLATVEAAEIVATGDPMWCPVGATPGDAGCTGSHTDFASLITTLRNNPLLYSGSGVIWVEAAYNGNDNSQITLDGTVLTSLSGAANTLTIRGGWSGGNNTTVNPATPSTSDVSMAVFNWQGNLVIENFDIVAAGDGANSGLRIVTTGNVTLDNVSVRDTPLNGSNPGDGANVIAGGGVSISNSEFNNNEGDGLEVSSSGNILLNTVSANDNTLTGAYLDTCRYGMVDPGVCAGSGAVTITGSSTAPYSNQFDHNGFNPGGSGNIADGLIVSSGGSIAIDHVQANLNSVGGATLGNAYGTGNVTINLSDFSLNPNGTGLYVFTAGNLNVTNINALGNSMGAQLYNDGSGATSISGSNFGTTPGTGNTATGLHVEAGGPVTLNNVTASYNGANGGYIEAESYITVDNSTFNGNVNSNYPDDPGLRATSWNGSITLTDVTASGNLYGPGVALDVFDAHAIALIGGSFNQNGTFGIQAGSDDGNIELDGVTASYNQVKGAYLGAFWAGNIGIFNSTFVENGSYGIYAFTNEGNINLNLVTVLGSDGGVGPGADDLTNYGAILEAGGDVTVSNGTFQRNTDVGLGIISGGQVDLNNVTADRNGGNGVEVYSITTAGPICEGETPVNIVVNVDGGTFTNNGSYGLMVKPGPGGTLVFVNPSTFGGNALGDYLIDLSQDFKDCTPEPKEEKPCDDDKDKGPLIVEVPPTGGPTVVQDCEQYSATILKLPDGTSVKIGCPFEGFSHLEEVLEENLPGSVGAGLNFLQGIDFRLTDGDGNLILNEDGTVTISFAIPEGSKAKHYSIVFWDPEANNGAGGWVELPPYEVGTSFALHPDNPEDGRTVFSGVKRVGNFVTATVDFSGTFVLVER